MRLYVTETISNIVDVEEIETIFEIADFDTGFGKIPESIIDAKGDLIAGTDDDTYDRLGVGSDGQYLQADSTQTTGIKWATVSAGGTVEMTNKSGDSVAAGDVVVFDVDNDEAFETTTVQNDLRVCGVVSEDIANDAAGSIYSLPGYIATVNCDTGAISRGEFLATSTTAKKATSGGYFKTNGAFGIALTAKAAGSAGTVKAMLIQTFTRGIGGGIVWAMGGTGPINNTQKYTFVTDAWSNVAGAAISSARHSGFGLGYASVAAFCNNGYTGSYASTVDKVAYATETSSVCSNTSINENQGGFLTELTTKGYMCGGTDGTLRSSCSKYTYATEADSALGTTLTLARRYIFGLSDGTYGYTVGGDSSGAKVTCEKITYATDTVADHNDGDLSSASYGDGGMSLIVAGYLPYVNTNHEKIVFSTGTSAHVADDYAYNEIRQICGSNGNGIGVTGGSLGAEVFAEGTETFSAAGGMATGKNLSANVSYTTY